MTVLMKTLDSLKYGDLPPEPPHPDWYPHLDHHTVTVPKCYYYVSFLERFWHTMDNMTQLEQRHFIARAEVRYEQWIHHFDASITVPPLDVAFMWHVHLLSPLHCYEDLVLRLPGKKLFETPFPLAELHGAPSDSNMKAWESAMGDEPYTLTKDNMYSGTFHRSCYKCGQRIELPWTTYYDQRYGIHLERFPHQCDGSADKQGIHVMDMVKFKLEADLHGKEGHPTVAGTLLNADGTAKTQMNKMVTHLKPLQVIVPENQLDFAYERQIHEQLKFLGQKYEYDANELLYAIRSCYHGNPSPFSIDLIHGVARQRKFHDMVMLSDWHDSEVLSSSLQRYHDFLYMMMSNPTVIAVPTVGIDVVFHTHMIQGSKYRTFLLKHLKRVINHDDGIPSTSLKEYAIETNQAWQLIPMRYFFVEKGVQDDDISWGTLHLSETGFHPDYYEGMIKVKKNQYKSIHGSLNDDMKELGKKHPKLNMVSVHSHGVESSFYASKNIEALTEMQNFIAEGMKRSVYGHIGSIHQSTGGQSAIYATDKRQKAGKPVTEGEDDNSKWYHLNINNSSNSKKNAFPSFSGELGTMQLEPPTKNTTTTGGVTRCPTALKKTKVLYQVAPDADLVLTYPIMYSNIGYKGPWPVAMGIGIS